VVAVVVRGLQRGRSSSLRAYFDGKLQMDIDFEVVCRAALAGDALASEALGRAARMLGNALVGLVNTLDLDLVVLGGKNFEQAGRLYAEEIERAIHQRVLYGHRRKVEVRSSRFGEDTGAVGAASLVLYSAFAPQLRGLPTE
jgi:predicted NBD/HSP70 family sugar kinase